MNDLSAPDSPGRTFPREDSLPDDDEIGTREVSDVLARRRVVVSMFFFFVFCVASNSHINHKCNYYKFYLS